MKKNLRWLIAGILALALTSCGVFFAPLEGRWNPLDPNFGDGYTEKNLYPTVDGYVASGMSTFQEGNTMMTGYNMNLALMKFATGDIPEDVPHAELRLYLDAELSTGPYPFRVRLILLNWDPATVSWTQATMDGFVAPNFSSAVPVRYAGWYFWDVTVLLQSVNPGSVKGLLVEPAATGMNASFQTTEYTINKPHLVIWTK